MDPVGQRLEVWSGDVGQRQAGQVAVAEFEYPRGQPEGRSVGADVPELGQGEQEASSGRPGEIGGTCDVAERATRILGVEGLDDGKPARE